MAMAFRLGRNRVMRDIEWYHGKGSLLSGRTPDITGSSEDGDDH